MDRREYKSKPFHLVTDPKTGEIKREVFPSDVDIGSQQIGANLKVYGTISGSLSGSAVTVRSASIDLDSYPFSTFDFGSGLKVANAGTGVAKVTATVTSSSVTTVGTFANRPVAGTAGNQYYTTDGPISFVDDGSSWRPNLSGLLGTSPPAASGWTQVSAGGASTTLADSFGTLLLSCTNGAGGEDIRIAYKTIASPSNYTYTVHLVPTVRIDTSTMLVGVGVRNSTSGNVALFQVQMSSSGACNLAYHKATADSNGASPNYTFSSESDIGIQLGHNAAAGVWMRITNDGTSRDMWVSANGFDWALAFSASHNDFIIEDQYLINIFSSNIGGGFTLSNRINSMVTP